MARRYGIFMALTLAMPGSVLGQPASAEGEESLFRVSAFAGLGNGPPLGTVLGARAAYHKSFALVYIELSAWRPDRFQGCKASWPDSYACSARGSALLGGLQLEPGGRFWARPFLDLGVGVFRRQNGLVDGSTGPALAVGGGVRLGVGGMTSWKLSWRQLRVHDRTYQVVMGDRLRSAVMTIELEVHPVR